MLQASLRCSGRMQRPSIAFIQRTPLQIPNSRTRSRSSASSQTHLAAQPTSSPSPPATRREHSFKDQWKAPPLPKAVFPRRTICIKGWTSFANMVEVFAVLRAVELKYGSIVEYHVTKDFEMPEKPFAMIFAAFANPASLSLVPLKGIELAIPAPAYKHRPGGVGWDDIEPLLGEVDRDPDFDRNHDLAISDRPGHVRQHIYVRVSPSKRELDSYAPPPDQLPTPDMQKQIAEKFLQWGGTQDLTPISNSQEITDKELFGESALDNVRMRAALRWTASALNKRNPYETYPDEEDATRAQSNDLPCSGKRSTASVGEDQLSAKESSLTAT